jgi:hypothetical protein
LAKERERRPNPVDRCCTLVTQSELLSMVESCSRAVGQRRALACGQERGVQPLQSLEIGAQLPVPAELAGETQAGLRRSPKRPSQRASEIVDFRVQFCQRTLFISCRKARHGSLDELEVVIAVATVDSVPLGIGNQPT